MLSTISCYVPKAPLQLSAGQTSWPCRGKVASQLPSKQPLSSSICAGRVNSCAAIICLAIGLEASRAATGEGSLWASQAGFYIGFIGCYGVDPLETLEKHWG